MIYLTSKQANNSFKYRIDMDMFSSYIIIFGLMISRTQKCEVCDQLRMFQLVIVPFRSKPFLSSFDLI